MTNFYSQLTTFPRLLPCLLPLIHIALTGSVYTTIAVACERCITVLAPFTQIKVTSSTISHYYYHFSHQCYVYQVLLEQNIILRAQSIMYLWVWTNFQRLRSHFNKQGSRLAWHRISGLFLWCLCVLFSLSREVLGWGLFRLHFISPRGQNTALYFTTYRPLIASWLFVLINWCPDFLRN